MCSRNNYRLDNVTIIKSIFQIFRDEPLAAVFPVLEDLMTDNDRHKQRAAAEAIGGNECDFALIRLII